MKKDEVFNFEIVKGNVFNITGYDTLVVPAQKNMNWDPTTGLGVEAEVYRRLGKEGEWVARRRKSKKEVWPSAECFVTDIKTKIAESDFSRLIHVVPPMCKDENWEVELYMCYYNAIRTAYEKHSKAVLIPLLGTGRNDVPDEMSMYMAEEAYVNFITIMLSQHEYKPETIRKLRVCVVRYEGEKHKYGPGQGTLNHRIDILAEKTKVAYEPEELDYRTLFYYRRIMLKKRNEDKFTKEQIFDKCNEKSDKYKIGETSFKEYLGKPIYDKDKKNPQKGNLLAMAMGLMLSENQVNAVLRDIGREELTDSERKDFARKWEKPGGEKAKHRRAQSKSAMPEREI